MEKLTIKEFLIRINDKYTYEHIRSLIRSGDIKGEVLDGRYLIMPEEVEKVLKRDLTPGRKAKKIPS